jgi:signal transduction histidine kinase
VISRTRSYVALAVFAPIGYLYMRWLLVTSWSVIHVYRGGFPTCDHTWPTKLNSCSVTDVNGVVKFGYSPIIAWIQFCLFTAAASGIAFLLARWVMAPIRSMADTVAQLGPTSMGVRIRARRTRDESGTLASAINAMLDRVADGYDAQRRFAANASHELRTPLATQRALIEVSLAEELTADQLKLLARQLLETNQRNEALIEGLLVLAETERGLLVRSPQRLNELVSLAICALRPFATERHIKIESHLKPIHVTGEQPLLERLAVNLVQNAVKYNEPGGWVRVELTAPATLTVSNSGPVVAPELVNGLFEPFRRASGDRLDHRGGVGLGLTIVRSIVAAHQGSVTATANPLGGLTVEVNLPSTRSTSALESWR